MTTTTMPAARSAQASSLIQPRLWAVGPEVNILPMSVRLKGQWVDIKAAMDHWGIEFNGMSGQAITRTSDECVVNGTLSVRS